VYRLETKEIIDRIEHRLKGEYLATETTSIDGQLVEIEKYKTRPESRVLNEFGVRAVVSAIEILLNKITFLSNIDDKEVENICLHIHISIAREIYDNWEEFGVRKNPGPSIVQIMNLIFLGLKRAQGAGERDALKQIHHIIEQIKSSGGNKGGFPFIGQRGGSNE